jgi:hypothetical protein
MRSPVRVILLQDGIFAKVLLIILLSQPMENIWQLLGEMGIYEFLTIQVNN